MAGMQNVAIAWGGACVSAAYQGHLIPLDFMCEAGHVHCLDNLYRERLATLNGERREVDNRWQQSWSLDSDTTTSGGELVFAGTLPHLRFTLTGNSGAHQGGLDGAVVLHGDQATFRRDACQLEFFRQGLRIQIKQKSDEAACGAPIGVYYDGNYIQTSLFKARPKPNLLSLKVLTDARQNAAAHALLGTDYSTLMDTINMQTGGDDQDGLGADVTMFAVRGLAGSNASIVMQKADRLWIGLLVFGKQNMVRMRYYTNAPAWKKRVPSTIQGWHDGFDENLPIDLMP